MYLSAFSCACGAQLGWSFCIDSLASKCPRTCLFPPPRNPSARIIHGCCYIWLFHWNRGSELRSYDCKASTCPTESSVQPPNSLSTLLSNLSNRSLILFLTRELLKVPSPSPPPPRSRRSLEIQTENGAPSDPPEIHPQHATPVSLATSI